MEDGAKLLKIQKYKLIVKKWESDFKKLNGSNPSKNDIKEAPLEIKTAYKKYWMLKTNELERSFMDATFDDSTFNDDLASDDPVPEKDVKTHEVNSDSNIAENVNLNGGVDATCSDGKNIIHDQDENNISTQMKEPSIPKVDSKLDFINDSAKKLDPLKMSNQENIDGFREKEKDESSNHSKSEENVKTSDEISDEKSVADENDVKKLNDKGWGAHLNKSAEAPKKSKSLTKSVSSHFLEKLFVGSKFKKKNPRKSKSFSRLNSLKKDDLPKTSQSTGGQDDGFPVDLPKYSQSASSKDDGFPLNFEKHSDKKSESVEVFPSCDTVENVNLAEVIAPFDSIVSNLNMSIKKATPDLSSINRTLKNEIILTPSLSARRKLDKGWLERCNLRSSIELSKQNSFDSGIDVSDSNLTRTLSQSTFGSSPFSPEEANFEAPKNNSPSQEDNSSDEDFILGSDSEGETSRSNFRCSQSSFNRSSTSKIETVTNKLNATPMNRTNSVDSIRHFPVDSLKNSSDSFVAKSESITSSGQDNDLSTSDNRKRASSNDNSFIESRLFKRFKENDSFSNADSPAVENKYAKNKLKEPSISFVDKQKQEILKKKLASGKANENFVRINIQKKVFVRGKKTMTNSKYKKQQWKAKKKLQNYVTGRSTTSDGDFQTCFKCNEIGHYARDCCKGQILLPKEDGDDELDCPFPTLEEAEEIASEMKEAAHLRKNQLNRDKTKTVDEVDDVDLTLPVPEDLVETFSHVEPYFKTNEDGSLIDTPLIVPDALLTFNHKQFRQGQEEAIMRILSGKSTLVTLCTGAGKSLIYQLPAYLYAQRSNCITLVVSPLISLMEDQILRIPPFMKAACLHTNQTEVQKNKILDSLKNGDINVLLVSPEAVVASDRMANSGFLRFLPPIAFACIDEAHCVSMWSHNFRPSYLMICRVLRERMGVKTILGLTASATQPTIESIVKHLGVTDGLSGVIRDVPLPDNLILSVSKDEHRDSALLKLLQGPRFNTANCIIVYCTRREECERLAAYLRTTLKDQPIPTNIKKSSLSYTAEAYHAGLSSGRRRQVQNAFMKGNVRIVVATVAFGMGINKSDIRGIIHYNMPARCENYVQEVGRAGRDGLPANCHLFLSSEGQDLNELRRHIYANSIARHTLRKLLEKVFVPCKCSARVSADNSDQTVKSCTKHERAFDIEEIVAQLDVPPENIMTLLCYLEAHPKKWIDILPQSYTSCKVNVYSGEMQLRKACKTCPPLAIAVAEERKKKNANLRNFEFPVVSLAASIGWDSGIVKHALSKVMWTEENGRPKKSGVNVEFTNLGFRVMAPGNLPPSELDEALNSLHEQVDFHEQTSLKQLQFLFNCLTEISMKSYSDCLDEADMERSDLLKKNIRAYFANEETTQSLKKIIATGLVNEGHVVSDIRNLIETHSDSSFTGLAVARIFHGISSPNYPAITWGRTRFWRAHLLEDFKSIVQRATIELIKFR